MNWQTLFNPFSKFSEKNLLGIGLISSMLLILACYFTNTKMDSLLHFSPAKNLDWLSISLFVIISLVYAIVLLFVLGKFLNKKTRFIDIVNTVLVSQVPVVFLLLSTKLIDIDNIYKQIATTAEKNTSLNLNIFDLLYFTIFGFATLLLLIYSSVLLFNGFKIATNIKKWQHIVLFAFVLLIGILICQLTLPQLIY